MRGRARCARGMCCAGIARCARGGCSLRSRGRWRLRRGLDVREAWKILGFASGSLYRFFVWIERVAGFVRQIRIVGSVGLGKKSQGAVELAIEAVLVAIKQMEGVGVIGEV